MDSGTHGRQWYTEEANNIAFSFFIETNCNINQIEGITIEIAEVVIKVLKHIYNIQLEIKEPNDIVFNHKKIGGILTQTKINGDIVKYMVVGIGINTNQQKFNKKIEQIASSIKNEFNININTLEFITEFCNLFEECLIKRKITFYSK